MKSDRFRARPRRTRSAVEYVDGILAGDRAVLGQAITLIESRKPEDSEPALDVVERLLPHTGRSLRTGVTGMPGAGKSTFLEALGLHLTRDRGETVAVLAIDPSSELSGGSILGDKTRMQGLASDERAFIRPSPSSGSIGGVARRTREAMLLCEAAGFRNIFVETVGVGQSETAVRGMVDFFLLLTIPGAGDELQGMKRGILEMADLIAINKSDGDNIRRAERARRELESALHLFPAPPHGWPPRVMTCSALKGTAISEIGAVIVEFCQTTGASGWFAEQRRRQAVRWMHDAIEDALRDRFRADARVRRELPKLEEEVLAGRLTPFRAARRVLGE